MSNSDTGPSTADDSDTKSLKASERHAALIRIKKQFYFLSIQGVLRLVEIFLSVIHIGVYGYYDTFYDKIAEEAMPPVFLATTRETFFMCVNFTTLYMTLVIVLACIVNARSHSFLLGSLCLFLFDFLQFIMVGAASAALILFYQEADAKKVYEDSITARQGVSITGIILAILHLVGSIYDIAIYWRRSGE